MRIIFLKYRYVDNESIFIRLKAKIIETYNFDFMLTQEALAYYEMIIL